MSTPIAPPPLEKPVVAPELTKTGEAGDRPRPGAPQPNPGAAPGNPGSNPLPHAPVPAERPASPKRSS